MIVINFDNGLLLWMLPTLETFWYIEKFLMMKFIIRNNECGYTNIFEPIGLFIYKVILDIHEVFSMSHSSKISADNIKS